MSGKYAFYAIPVRSCDIVFSIRANPFDRFCPFHFYGNCSEQELISGCSNGREAQLENVSLGETWLNVVYNSDIRIEIGVLN
jgi:hypothetical protein